MNEKKSIEINCPACGRESLLKHKPRYEGFKKVGEDLCCSLCGHTFADEKEIPFKEQKIPQVFDRRELDARPQVFKPGEAARLCRYCAHYIVNPFVQRCALLKKEVEATDSCKQFKARQSEQPEK
jgi:hypothetical protein